MRQTTKSALRTTRSRIAVAISTGGIALAAVTLAAPPASASSWVYYKSYDTAKACDTAGRNIMANFPSWEDYDCRPEKGRSSFALYGLVNR